MPKWWATSWMTVLRTWATTSSSVEQTLQMALLVKGDSVGHDPRVALGPPAGERDPLIEPEERPSHRPGPPP